MLSKPDKHSAAAAGLRRGAEERFKARQAGPARAQAGLDTAALIHELEVHQIELEMQNEALTTSREQAEALAEEYVELYDFAPVGYLTLEREGTICETNLAGASLLGVDRSRLLRQRLGLHLSAAELPVFNEFLQRVFTSQVRQACEVSLLREGKPAVEVRLEAVVADSGQKCLAAMLDLTDRKRAEASRLISSKLEATGILAGGIAHDFNNLLTVIRMNLDMAQTLIADAGDLWDYLSEAKKSALQASGLSQRLITFAEGGAPVRSLVCLPAVIQDAVRPAVIGSHARGELSLPGNLWSVEADERQIKQALQNVIQNAIEAMTEARVVAVQAENLTLCSPAEGALPPGDYVRISITDRGRGIPPEDLPKVFDPYFSTKQRGVRKGMGLGLTIAHTIINKHGGTMSVESKVGQGTTVRLFLPASRKPPVTGEAALPPDNPQRARILVMDDEAGLRTVLSATLRRLGHTVELAEDGRQAIEAYAQAKHAGRPFDLVMLDLTVHGGVGGYEAMLGLREIDPGVKAILMSGYSTDRIFLNYESAGFKAALAKPFDLAKVKESIAWALGT